MTHEARAATIGCAACGAQGDARHVRGSIDSLYCGSCGHQWHASSLEAIAIQLLELKARRAATGHGRSSAAGVLESVRASVRARAREKAVEERKAQRALRKREGQVELLRRRSA